MLEMLRSIGLRFFVEVANSEKRGVAILRNTNGFYAAIKIIDIKDDKRNSESDELTFRFAIQTDGSPPRTACP